MCLFAEVACTLTRLRVSTVTPDSSISRGGSLRRVELAKLGHKLLTIKGVPNGLIIGSGLLSSTHRTIVHFISFLHHLKDCFTLLLRGCLLQTDTCHHTKKLVLSLRLLTIEKLLHFLDTFRSDRNTTSTCLCSHIRLPSKQLLSLERLLKI